MAERDYYMRYSRQLLLPQLDEDGQCRLLNSQVVIIGLGGLGTVAANYLAGAGVGHLTLVDHDTISMSNLQRQINYSATDIGRYKANVTAAKLRQLNPDICIQPVLDKAAPHNINSLLNHCDLVLDCSDNLATRFLVNQSCLNKSCPLIIGAAAAFEGQFIALNPTGQHGCYQCLYGENQTQSQNCLEQGVLGPVVGMMGMMQALEALKFLSGAAQPKWGQLQLFDGLNNQWRTLLLPKHEGCKACGGKNEHHSK